MFKVTLAKSNRPIFWTRSSTWSSVGEPRIYASTVHAQRAIDRLVASGLLVSGEAVVVAA